jgi:MFS family permease
MAESNTKTDANTVEVLTDDKVAVHDGAVKTFQKQSPLAALKEAPFAIITCCYMLFTCIMWGYDGLAAAIVISIPRWRQDYGYLWQGQYVVAAKWQLGFTAGSLLGLFVGGLATGVLSKHFGQKKCMYGAHLLTIGGVFAQWFSPGNLPLFFGGKVLTGLPLGVFLTIAPTYCGEVAPEVLRGTMVGAVNFCMVIGQLLGYGVMRETQAIDGPNAYRIMYAVQWGFAAIGLGCLPFIPESPFRLLAMKKTEEARKSIARLYGSHKVEEKMENIRMILEDQAQAAEQSGSFRDCFNAKNRKRTLITLSIYMTTNMAGTAWVVGTCTRYLPSVFANLCF